MRVPTAEAMRALGAEIAGLLAAGDLLVLTGELGAGKTTLSQGIGAGLGVTGAVRSPTFVIARVHRSGRVPLVHVDAYRLGSAAELDDLDLDAELAESITVVEWGEGLAEGLAADRLEVRIGWAAGSDYEAGAAAGREVAGEAGSEAGGEAGGAAGGAAGGEGGSVLRGEGGSEEREVSVTGFGPRWAGVALPGGGGPADRT